MKQVSFKIANAIKDAGYPQDIEFWKYLEDSTYWYYQDGKLERKGNMSDYVDVRRLIFAPTYIEVWLWLWREKKTTIDVVALAGGSFGAFIWKFGERLNSKIKFDDPEEAIIAAIEDLADNNLIK